MEEYRSRSGLRFLFFATALMAMKLFSLIGNVGSLDALINDSTALNDETSDLF